MACATSGKEKKMGVGTGWTAMLLSRPRLAMAGRVGCGEVVVAKRAPWWDGRAGRGAAGQPGKEGEQNKRLLVVYGGKGR